MKILNCSSEAMITLWACVVSGNGDTPFSTSRGSGSGLLDPSRTAIPITGALKSFLVYSLIESMFIASPIKHNGLLFLVLTEIILISHICLELLRYLCFNCISLAKWHATSSVSLFDAEGTMMVKAYTVPLLVPAQSVGTVFCTVKKIKSKRLKIKVLFQKVNLPFIRKVLAKYKHLTNEAMESSTGLASICLSTGLASNGLKSPCSVVGGFLAGGEVGC